MFNRKEMILFFENLADQINAGIDVAESLKMVARLIPNQEKLILDMHQEILKGNSFYHVAFKEGLFTESILEQIKIGEKTGELGATLKGISSHESMMHDKVASAKKQIVPPLAILFTALAIGFGFIVYGLPNLAILLDRKARTEGVFGLSTMLNEFISSNPYFYPVLAVILFGVPVLIATNKSVGKKFFQLSLKMPFYGEGMKHILWAGWCNYIAMSIKAGMDWNESLKMSLGILPEEMAAAIENVNSDIMSGKDWARATDSSLWEEGDERFGMPILLVAALRIGGPIGQLDEKLNAIVERLLKLGEDRINKSTDIAKFVALGMTALTIVSLFSLVISAQVGSVKGML